MSNLNPQKGLIFRIVHKENAGLILDDGCRCRSATEGSQYVEMGNPELIQKRGRRAVPCGPKGVLSDYVPFYFTPHSPMLYNIKTGYNGIRQRPMRDVLILVSSLHHLASLNIPFVFTDRHAYLKTARFSNDLADLDWIIWSTLQAKDFTRDDTDKFEKYQAEALVHMHVPLDALLGIVCYDDSVKGEIEAETVMRNATVRVLSKQEWFL